MEPLFVAVIGAGKESERTLGSLKQYLSLRGLRVGKDVVLIPCSSKNRKHLALQLEREWNHRWLTWYNRRHGTQDSLLLGPATRHRGNVPLDLPDR